MELADASLEMEGQSTCQLKNLIGNCLLGRLVGRLLKKEFVGSLLTIELFDETTEITRDLAEIDTLIMKEGDGATNLTCSSTSREAPPGVTYILYLKCLSCIKNTNLYLTYIFTRQLRALIIKEYDTKKIGCRS